MSIDEVIELHTRYREHLFKGTVGYDAETMVIKALKTQKKLVELNENYYEVDVECYSLNPESGYLDYEEEFRLDEFLSEDEENV